MDEIKDNKIDLVALTEKSIDAATSSEPVRLRLRAKIPEIIEYVSNRLKLATNPQPGIERREVDREVKRTKERIILDKYYERYLTFCDQNSVGALSLAEFTSKQKDGGNQTPYERWKEIVVRKLYPGTPVIPFEKREPSQYLDEDGNPRLEISRIDQNCRIHLNTQSGGGYRPDTLIIFEK